MKNLFYTTILILLTCMGFCAYAQQAPKVVYSNNPQAGHYLNVGDARIYY